MSEIDEIRKRWKGITSKSLIIDPPKDAWTTILLSCYVADDIHALLAALDAATAERDALKERMAAFETMRQQSKTKGCDALWRDIIYKDGKLDEEAILNELADFSFVLSQVPIVYGHVTDGRMSKVMYYANDVIREADYIASQERDEAYNEGKAGAIAERDALKARVEDLEARWVGVLLSVKSSLVPQSQGRHRSFRDGWMAAIDYALQLLNKEAKPNG